MNGLWLVMGMGLLALGAELFIRGGSGLADSLNISPIVVGLTLVAYGTGSPELLVSLQSAWQGQVQLALGNVVGSNVFNVLLVIGATACVAPLTVHHQLIWWDVPLLIGITGGVCLVAWGGPLTPIHGIVLLLILGVYTAYALVTSGNEPDPVHEAYEKDVAAARAWTMTSGPLGYLLTGLLGLGFLLLGSRWFSGAAVEFARTLGLSEWVIGATIVSVGTSLPEFGTSLLAALRGEQDLAVGNVIGSNLFNLTGILGGSLLLGGKGVFLSESILTFDLIISVGVAVACLPVFWSGHRINRLEGFLFLVYYVGYVLVIIYRPSFVLGSVRESLLFLSPLLLVTGYIGVQRYRNGEDLGVPSDA